MIHMALRNTSLLLLVFVIFLFFSGCIPGYKINLQSETIEDAIIKEEIIENHNVFQNNTILQIYLPSPSRIVVHGNSNTVEIEEATDIRGVQIYGADNVIYIPKEREDSVIVVDDGFETTIVYY